MIVGAAAVSVGSPYHVFLLAELCLHPVLQSELVCTCRLIAGECCSVCSRSPDRARSEHIKKSHPGAEMAAWVKHCPKSLASCVQFWNHMMVEQESARQRFPLTFTCAVAHVFPSSSIHAHSKYITMGLWPETGLL